ncbi:hypothetical protein [Prosthecobacter fusiformis]|nr:hypothetical protein [Prosthecobacter fusiformis]
MLLTACGSNPLEHSPPRETIRRSEVIQRAEVYAQHRWRPTSANVRHGRDAQAIQVDTPDVGYAKCGWWRPGRWNQGMPYQWGGFDTPTEFDQKVRSGLAAGDVYTAAKRAGLDAAVSREAAGIDCSGLISRCWQLERSYSTRELPSLCVPLSSYDELRPGDILNTHNAHVLLFADWGNTAGTQMWVYEAGSYPTWKVLRRQVDCSALREKGYLPFRYRHILE